MVKHRRLRVCQRGVKPEQGEQANEKRVSQRCTQPLHAARCLDSGMCDRALIRCDALIVHGLGFLDGVCLDAPATAFKTDIAGKRCAHWVSTETAIS